jgi:CubicO group peptidase (beta-lactamase class C family)
MKSIRLIAGAAVAFAPLATGPQSPAASNEAKARELDAYVAQAVKEWNVAGLAIAVVKDGKVVFGKGYGVREIGKPAAVDTSTLFAIASTTKAMTVASIGMLVDEGKLKWDDPVTKYLPSFQMFDPYVTRELTIRDLLTHRAGLGNADYLWDIDDYSMPEIESRMKLVKPAYSFRSGFIYQNVMYMVAGDVIAAVSGMPWEQFVRTRIFAPVGMRSSIPHLKYMPANSNMAIPHWRYGGDTVVAIENTSAQAIGPAGGVWSNVADMSRWMLFLLDSGRVGGKRLLTKDTYEEMFKPQTMVPPDEFYPTAELTRPHWTTYGLGWFQEDYNGRMLNFHTGSLSGMVAIIGLVQDARFGVYVLANVDHAEIRHALMYKATDLFLGNPPRDWSTELNKLYSARRKSGDSLRVANDSKRLTGTRPTLALSNYAGTYEDPLLGRMVVTDTGGKLRITMGPRYAGELEHWENDTFRVHYDRRWEGTDQISFTIGNGVPTALNIAGYSLARVSAGGASATH